MDLKVACVAVCLCALAITSTEAGIPKCCVTTRPRISMYELRNVYRMDWQRSTGACDIEALILHVKGYRKPICANPKMLKNIQRPGRRLRKRNHH